MVLKKNSKKVLGRQELVSFPELEIEDIPAKIDTGAYSTAIHAHKIWTEGTPPQEVLCFELLDPKNEFYQKRVVRTINFYRKKVRSSNGKLEERFMIKTKLIIGNKMRITDLSLTNRGKMKYPVLIGRKVLKKGFLVDVSISGL